MSIPEVFQRITSVLEGAGIAYMLSGSFASAHYGTPRATQDIDLIIEATPAQLRSLVDSLPRDKYYVDVDAALEALVCRSMFNVIDLATGWKIDLIIRKSRPFSEKEFGRRQRIDVQGIHLFVASAEDVILSKLEWAKLSQSLRHVEDAAGILRLRWGTLDHTYLETWVHALQLQTQWQEAKQKAAIVT
jgi:hypothetical protein